MSMPPEPTVTRTYRAAVKHGDDYTTVEETITLPSTASEAEIQQAVATGWRIFEIQRESILAQIAQVRAEAPAITSEPLASDGQRRLIDTLAEELGWSPDELAAFAAERGIADWTALTKRLAGTLIDALKAHKADRERQHAPEEQPREPDHRRPDPAQLQRARQAQHEAHARVGMATPPAGQRPPIVIRDPDAPASDAQLALIRRRVGEYDDATLETLSPRIAALFGAKTVTVKRLRAAATWPELRTHADPAKQLTKGRASALIALLDREERRAA